MTTRKEPRLPSRTRDFGASGLALSLGLRLWGLGFRGLGVWGLGGWGFWGYGMGLGFRVFEVIYGLLYFIMGI